MRALEQWQRCRHTISQIVRHNQADDCRSMMARARPLKAPAAQLNADEQVAQRQSAAAAAALSRCSLQEVFDMCKRALARETLIDPSEALIQSDRIAHLPFGRAPLLAASSFVPFACAPAWLLFWFQLEQLV